MKTYIYSLLFSVAMFNPCSAITIEVYNSTNYPLIITDPHKTMPLTEIDPLQHKTINYPNQTQQPAITIAAILPETTKPTTIYMLPLTQVAPEKNYRLWISEAVNSTSFQMDITLQNETDIILKTSRYCNKPHDFSNDHRVY